MKVVLYAIRESVIEVDWTCLSLSSFIGRNIIRQLVYIP
jgi:hypothetical protein